MDGSGGKEGDEQADGGHSARDGGEVPPAEDDGIVFDGEAAGHADEARKLLEEQFAAIRS